MNYDMYISAGSSMEVTDVYSITVLYGCAFILFYAFLLLLSYHSDGFRAGPGILSISS